MSNSFKDLLPQNKPDIIFTLVALKLEIFNSSYEEKYWNILHVVVVLIVLKLERSNKKATASIMSRI